MKSKLVFLVMCACGGAPSASSTSTAVAQPHVAETDASPPKPVAAASNLPSANRVWTAKDYSDCATALRVEALPRVGSETFSRMVTTDNLAPYRVRSNTHAVGDIAELDGAVPKVFGVYLQALKKDASFVTEVFALTQFLVHAGALTWTLSDELLVTVDANEAAYPTRLDGVARMRKGAAELVDGTLTMHPPASFWVDAGADWASIVLRLRHEDRAKALSMFGALEREAKDDATRSALASTRRALTHVSAPDFTMAKDGAFMPRVVATPRDIRATLEVDADAPARSAIDLVSRVRTAGAQVVSLQLASDARRLWLTPPRIERAGSPDDLALTAFLVHDGVSLKTHGGNIGPGCEPGAGLVAPNKPDGSRDTEALATCATKLKSAAPTSHSVTIVSTSNVRFADVLAVADALDAFSDVRLTAVK